MTGTRCPDCTAPLSPAAPCCPACGLPLNGAAAAELGRIDLRLLTLGTERSTLLTRRTQLLHYLRAARASHPQPASPQPVSSQLWHPQPAFPQPRRPQPAFPQPHLDQPYLDQPYLDQSQSGSAGANDAKTTIPSPAAQAAHARKQSSETSSHTIQNTLLALGGLLLGVAAIVFTVVAWGRFGIGGKATILGAITMATLIAPALLVKRGLRATAETLTCLGILLLVLDGYAGWQTNLAGIRDLLDSSTYAGLVALGVTLIVAGYSLLVPVRFARPVAIAAAQPVLPLLAAQSTPGLTGWAAVSALLALANLGFLAGPSFLPSTASAPLENSERPPSRRQATWIVAAVAGSTGGAAATLLCLAALVAYRDPVASVRAGSLLVAVAGLAIAAGAVLKLPVLRETASGWAVVAAVLAGEVVYSRWSGADPLTFLAGLTVLASLVCVILPRRVRPGASVGALVVVSIMLPLAVLWATAALAGPLSWVSAPWTAPGGSTRTLLMPDTNWPFGSQPLPAILLLGIAAALLAGRWLGHRAVLTVAIIEAVSVIPLAGFSFDLPWLLVLAAEGLAGISLLATGLRYQPGPVSRGWYTAGLILVIHAAAWSLADQRCSLVALGMLVLVSSATAAFALARRRTVLAIPAAVLALVAISAEVAATGVLVNLPAPGLTGLLMASSVPALLTTAAFRDRQAQVAVATAAVVPGIVLVAVLTGLAHGLGLGPLSGTAAVLIAIAALTLPAGPGRLGLTFSAVLPLSAAILSTLPAAIVALLGSWSTLSRIWDGTPVSADSLTAASETGHGIVSAGAAPISALLFTLACTLLVLSNSSAGDSLTERRPWIGPGIMPGLALAVLTAPLALNLAWTAAAQWTATLASSAVLAVCGTGILTGLVPARWLPSGPAGMILRIEAGAVTLLAGSSVICASLATPASTLVVLAVTTALTVVVAAIGRPDLSRQAGTVLAGISAQGLAFAVPAAAGTPRAWCGIALLVPVAVEVGAAALIRTSRPAQAILAEFRAAGGAVLAVLLTAGSLWHTGLALALTGAILAGIALRSDRTFAALAAVCCELLASWAWLAAGGIRTPEAYTLPVALAVLTAGLMLSRRRPESSSWVLLAPGLAAALLPSLLLTFTSPDQNPRRILLGAGALTVTLAGARLKRQGPFVLGTGVLAVVAVHELGPALTGLVTTVPRWIPLALAGTVLLATGATYERRRRELAQLRDAVLEMR